MNQDTKFTLYQFSYTNLSLLSSRLNVPLCINFSTLLVMVLLFILLSVAFSHSDYKKKYIILLTMIFHVHLESMCPAVFKTCREAARTWLFMCLTSTCDIYSCSCGSLPLWDHYFGCHICSLFLMLIYMDYCFDCLLCHLSTQPFPPLIRIILVNGI